MALPALIVESFAFNPPLCLDGKSPLRMAAKRYTDGRHSKDGLTVLLAHGTGTHKEHWEPMLQNLFKIRSTKSPPHRIREAWAFDWQNHGHSAVLNSETLKTRPDGVSIAHWAHALVAFVNSKHAVRHRLIVVGHSTGASAWMYSTKFFPFRIPYMAIILVEPVLFDRDTFHKTIREQDDCGNTLPNITTARRDAWPSKVASEYFSKRVPWNDWDARVLRIYVDQSLRAEPLEGHYADYQDYEATFDATDQISKVCNNVSIHVIYGEINDFIPRYMQASPVDQSKGRRVASVVQIPRVGHMIHQQQPNALAQSISNLFDVSLITRPALASNL